MASASRGMPRASSALARVERPLESVVGLAEMLFDRSRDVSAAARDKMIEQLAIRAEIASPALRNLLLADLLARGEVEADAETVELRELAESAAQEWMLAGQGARISVSGSIDALGDARWISRVLRNLFEDALERGGRNVEVRMSAAYSKVVVEIEDDGAEVPTEDRDAPHIDDNRLRSGMDRCSVSELRWRGGWPD